MMAIRTSALLMLSATVASGCGMRTVRTPSQMIDSRPRFSLRRTAKLQPTSRPAQTRSLERPEADASEPVAPAQVITAARHGATEHPTPDGFINAVQVYNYSPGVVYEVITTPGFVTAIRMRPGERLLAAAAGDTSRWLVDVIESGVADESSHDTARFEVDEAPNRTTVIVKPRRPLMQTNLIIATNERTYLLDLKNVDVEAYHSAIEWTYPADQLRLLKGAPRLSRSVAPARRTYAYLIKAPSDKVPVWAPVAAYHDGARVTIEFRVGVPAFRRPPLFVLGENDELELVNYRVEDNRYIVDRLFDRAELRLGEQRIRIEHVRVANSGFFNRLFRAFTDGD